MTKDNDEQTGGNRGNVAKTMLYKVAKTMLFLKPQPPQPQPQPMAPDEPPAEKPKTKVAKTQLDHRLIQNIQSQAGERKNERLQQEIANRQLEPVKEIEPIKEDKKVRSCPFSWTDQSVKSRFLYCGHCQRQIYQLDGLEENEAEALIFKRENLDKFVLYKRPDGKFMTSDCPVAQKKRFQIIGLAAFVCVCAAAAVAAFIMMPPQSPTDAVTSDPSEPAPSAVTTTDADSSPTPSGKSDTSSTSSGTHHYEAGDPIPVVPSAQPAKSKQPEKTFSEQEQKGEFWQFPNGQPADDFSRSTVSPSAEK